MSVSFNIAFNFSIARVPETLYIWDMHIANFVQSILFCLQPRLQLLARPLLRLAR
jgi:hypothetical protein